MNIQWATFSVKLIKYLRGCKVPCKFELIHSIGQPTLIQMFRSIDLKCGAGCWRPVVEPLKKASKYIAKLEGQHKSFCDGTFNWNVMSHCGPFFCPSFAVFLTAIYCSGKNILCCPKTLLICICSSKIVTSTLHTREYFFECFSDFTVYIPEQECGSLGMRLVISTKSVQS